MADDVQVSVPEPTGRPMRGLRQNVGDMIRSMAVVLAVVGAILLVTWRPQPDAIREVPLEPLVTMASSQADFPVLVVRGDAQPTSVRWEPTQASDGNMVWHIGYVTSDEEYLQLSQSLAESDLYVIEQTSEGLPVTLGAELPDVVQELASQGWLPYEGGTSEVRRSLVRTDSGATTVVSGTGSWEQVGDAVRNLVVP